MPAVDTAVLDFRLHYISSHSWCPTVLSGKEVKPHSHAFFRPSTYLEMVIKSMEAGKCSVSSSVHHQTDGKTPYSVMWLLIDFAFQPVWIDHVSTVPLISTFYVAVTAEVFAGDQEECVALSHFQLALRPVVFLFKSESAITGDLRCSLRHVAVLQYKWWC